MLVAFILKLLSIKCRLVKNLNEQLKYHGMRKNAKPVLKKLTSAFVLLMISCGMLKAQYFTKIVNEITTDNGNSRSVNWIDYDNDGDLDVYISNGVEPPINSFLYENMGNGTFIKHIDAEVAKNKTSADGSSWADYNNDGFLELYIVAWYNQRSYLYNNSGNGIFTKETEGILGKARGNSESCSWGDYDNDGYVDLYVANSGGKVLNYFYHNDCGKSFTRIMTGNPATDKATSRTVNWVDYDNDGDLDLFVTNEINEPNNLYKNLLTETGKPEFEKITNDPVVLSYNNSISSCWCDYDNDGDLDLFIANSGQNNELYQNNGNGTFTKITDGIQSNETGCSLGCNWADFDNDGDLDLFVTNGWCDGNQNKNNYLYRNLLMEKDSAVFEKVTDTVVTNDGGWSYGSSWGDYDQDGDLDLLVAKCSDKGTNIHNSLFRNEIGNKNNWITIKCSGIISNASAIGAKILVKATIHDKPTWQIREVSAQESYCSENLFSHFGLGDASSIDSITVKWPSGIKQYFTHVDTNQFLTVIEDTLLFTGMKPVCNPMTYIKSNDECKDNASMSVIPNPVYEDATISYRIKSPGQVTLKLTGINGIEIRKIFNEYKQAGSYKVTFNCSGLHEDIYLLMLNSNDGVVSSKLLVIR
jgi:enediyne biosynthesis protein E4